MSDNIYYVYALIDPRNNKPFYIGKGKEKRCFTHLSENKERTDNIYKWNTIQKIYKLGLEPTIKFFERDISENDAYDIEEELIKHYGRKRFDKNGILTNLCLGARPPVNNRGCVAISGLSFDEYYGKEKADKIRKKMSDSVKGEKNRFYGKTHTITNKLKFATNASKQWKGVSKTESHLKNLKKTYTPKRREKLRQNRIIMNKKLNTPEMIDKLRLRNINHGREKTKQTIINNLIFYQNTINDLNNGLTPKDIKHKNNFSHSVYSKIWMINKNITYYNDLIDEING